MIFAVEDVTPATQAITFALTGALVTVLTLYLTNRSKRQTLELAHHEHEQDEELRLREKAEDRDTAIAKEARDYARQDALQLRIEERAAATMNKLQEVEDLGRVTHALVNSDKTATMKDQRDGWMVTLALMNEVISLKEQSGRAPSEESRLAIAALRTRIATLDSSIEDRLRQQLAAEQRVEHEKKDRGSS